MPGNLDSGILDLWKLTYNWILSTSSGREWRRFSGSSVCVGTQRGTLCPNFQCFHSVFDPKAGEGMCEAWKL